MDAKRIGILGQHPGVLAAQFGQLAGQFPEAQPVAQPPRQLDPAISANQHRLGRRSAHQGRELRIGFGDPRSLGTGAQPGEQRPDAADNEQRQHRSCEHRGGLRKVDQAAHPRQQLDSMRIY
jgi:hypothetical protein